MVLCRKLFSQTVCVRHWQADSVQALAAMRGMSEGLRPEEERLVNIGELPFAFYFFLGSLDYRPVSLQPQGLALRAMPAVYMGCRQQPVQPPCAGTFRNPLH